MWQFQVSMRYPYKVNKGRMVLFCHHAVKWILWTNSQAAGHYTVSHTHTHSCFPHSHAPACPTPSLSSSSSLDQSGSSHAVIANWCTNPVVKYCAKELGSASKVNTCRHSSMCFASTKRIEEDGVVTDLPCLRTNTEERWPTFERWSVTWAQNGFYKYGTSESQWIWYFQVGKQ